MAHLSCRGELTEVRQDWIAELEAWVAAGNADGSTARGFNQVGGLVAAGCKIHMSDILTEHAAR